MEGVTQEEAWEHVVNAAEAEATGSPPAASNIEDNDKKDKKRKRKRKRKNRNRSDSASADSTTMSVESDISPIGGGDEEAEEPPKKRAAKEAAKVPPKDVKIARDNNGKKGKGKDNGKTATAKETAASLKSAPPPDSTSQTKHRPRPASLLAAEDNGNNNTMAAPPTSFQQTQTPPKPAAKEADTPSQVDEELDPLLQQFGFEDDPNVVDMLLQQAPRPIFEFNYSIRTILSFVAWAYVALILVVRGYGFHITNSTSSLLATKCFRNNVHTRAKYQGDCGKTGMDPTIFAECPPWGICWGGQLQDCRFGGSSKPSWNTTYFFEVSPSKQQCQLTDAARASVEGMVVAVAESTMAHDCGVTSDDFAPPIWWDVSAGDTYRPRPMFVLADVSEMDADDALELVRAVAPEYSLFLSNMPKVGHPSPWLGGRTIEFPSNPNANNDKVPAGTPLIGLNQQMPWRKWWLPLFLQCGWNGMIPTGNQQPNVNVEQPKEQPKEQNNASTKYVSPEMRLLNATKVKAVNLMESTQHRAKDVKDKIVTSINNRGMMTQTTLTSYMNNAQNQKNESMDTALEDEKESSSFLGWVLGHLYLLVSLVGFVAISYIQYQQKKYEAYQDWMPEVARLREMALERIEEATNGGFVLTHLRDTVLRAFATASDEEGPRNEPRHLRHYIWPRVVEELRNEPQVFESTVISRTTGQAQEVFSWKEFANQASADAGDSGEATTSETSRRQSPRKNAGQNNNLHHE